MPPKFSQVLRHIFVVAIFIYTAAANAGEIRPYLYEVRRGQAVSYMLGTLHFGIALDELRPYVDERLRRSRQVYFEIVNDREAEQIWATDPVRGFVDSAPRAGRELSAMLRRRLVAQYGLDPRVVNALKDRSCDLFFVALMLGQPALDSQLQLTAMDAGLPVLPLEDDALRAEADRAEPPEKCRLRDVLRHSRRDWQAMTDQMIRDYRVGAETPSRSRELQVRNARWLQTLVPELAKGGVFVAVGVDHLFEEKQGLVPRLRAAGFEVTRVPVSRQMVAR